MVFELDKATTEDWIGVAVSPLVVGDVEIDVAVW